MNTESLSTLKIHKLTQAQYDREFEAGNLDENALYLLPDVLELDTTLTQPGVAADAKAVGDALLTLGGGSSVMIDEAALNAMLEEVLG